MRTTLHLFSLSPNKESVEHKHINAIKLPNQHYFLFRKPFLISQEQLGNYLPESETLILSSYHEAYDTIIKERMSQILVDQAEVYLQTATILKEKARKLRND